MGHGSGRSSGKGVPSGAGGVVLEQFLARELTRRALLRQAMRAGVVVAGDGLVAACGGSGSGAPRSDAGPGHDAGPGRDSGPDPDGGADERDASAPGSAVVGIARGASRADSIERAVALAGGLGFVRGGDSVLLKPNCNSGEPFPFSTHPDTIRTLVGMLRDLGAGRIVIGDRGFFGASTAQILVDNGIAPLGDELGVEIADWDSENADDWIAVPFERAPDWGGSEGFWFPRVLSEVDHIISLPVLKTHFIAYFTAGLKNWIGITAGSSRSGGLDHDMPKLARSIAQIHAAVTPSLLVLDAFEPVVQGGPRPDDPPGAETREAGLVLAAHDAIALDVAGLAILKHLDSPATEIRDRGIWDQPQITAAIELGLGITGPTEVELAGDGVDELEALRALVAAA